MRPISLIVCLVGLSACAHPQLTARGSEVILLKPSAVPTCERIAAVVGKSWGSVFFGDSLLDTAENSLRNRAGEAGATHVVVTRHDPSAHGYFLEGDAYRCSQPGTQPAAPATPDAAESLPPAAPSPGDATPLPPAAPTP